MNVSAVTMLACAMCAFVVAAPLFLLFPELDLASAGLFFTSEGKFSGKTPAIELARKAFKVIYIAAVVIAIAAIWLAHGPKIILWGLSATRWLTVLLVLMIGPGLIANVVFKNEWGRARPAQTEIFGGTKEFTPALVPAHQCAHNCSFVSGEASSMFAIFFALAMVSGPGALRFVIIGLFAGGLAGLIRIAQGAHFLSDVIFAGIFMAMAAAIVRFIIIDLPEYRTRQTALMVKPS